MMYIYIYIYITYIHTHRCFMSVVLCRDASADAADCLTARLTACAAVALILIVVTIISIGKLIVGMHTYTYSGPVISRS